MKKVIAISLLCCLSSIFTFECFADALDNVDGLELYESDTEETEKELEDLKTTHFGSSSYQEMSNIELPIRSSQADSFKLRKTSHREINTPPPELN